MNRFELKKIKLAPFARRIKNSWNLFSIDKVVIQFLLFEKKKNIHTSKLFIQRHPECVYRIEKSSFL